MMKYISCVDNSQALIFQFTAVPLDPFHFLNCLSAIFTGLLALSVIFAVFQSFHFVIFICCHDCCCQKRVMLKCHEVSDYHKA